MTVRTILRIVGYRLAPLILVSVLLTPIDVLADWGTGRGVLLHHGASVESAASGNRFSVECSGDGTGYYTIAVVYVNRALEFTENLQIDLEVYRGGSLYYTAGSGVDLATGLPGVYAMQPGDQIFNPARQHIWVGALREGIELRVLVDGEPLDTFDLDGSNRAILDTLARCAEGAPLPPRRNVDVTESTVAADTKSGLAALGYETGAAEFERAVEDGNADAVDLFLAMGFDLAGKVDGAMLMFDAAAGGQADIVGSLLNSGVDGGSALWFVLEFLGDLTDAGTVGLLLEAGVNANSLIPEDAFAMSEGRLLDGFLVENLLNSLMFEDSAGPELLEVVSLFVEHGLDVHAISEEGETIFHTIVSTWAESTPDMLRLLVDAGGDINMSGNGAVPPVLLGASLLGPDEIETLLALGADPDQRDDDGRNAVMIAAEQGAWETMSVLIDAGADFSSPDDAGNTALHHALLQANAEMARTLMDAGADVPDEATAELYLATAEGNDAGIDVALSGGPSGEALDGALLIAIRIENDSAVSRLLAAGASPDAPDEDGNPILFEAVLSDRMEVVDALLSAGASLDARSSSDETIADVAADAGSAAVMTTLLENGVDANTASPDGRTLLMRTASAGGLGFAFLIASMEALDRGAYYAERQDEFSGHAEVAELLIGRGADVNATDLYGGTALIEAVMVGNGPVLRLLIEAGADLNHQNEVGSTALDQAREQGPGFEFVVDMLVEAGAGGDAELLPADGAVQSLADLGYEANETELRRAVLEGSVEAVDLFLEAGFDPRWYGDMSEGWIELLVDPPLLSDAATSGHADVAKSLLNAGADGALGLRSVLNDMVVDLDAIRLLLVAGASPNSQVLFEVPFNDRLLEQFLVEDNLDHLMSGSADVEHFRRRFEIMKLFIDHGLDLNATNRQGETIFHTIVRLWNEGTPDILGLLVEAGGDINLTAPEALPPILLGTSREGPGAVATLLALGADPDLTNEQGENALLIAAKEGDQDILSVLIDAGSDVNAANVNGNTALITSVMVGNGPVLRLLIEAGADLDHQNELGTTALMQAREQGEGFEFLVDMLVEAGAGG